MQAEELVRVGPDVSRRPARARGKRLKLLDGIFVRVLGVDALAFGETKLAAEHVHGVARQTHKMHLDTAACLVVDRVMGEAADIDVTAELAIYTLKQVEVEGGGDAALVVIGRDQDGGILLEIDSDEKRGATPEQPRCIGGKRQSLAVSQIADGRA